MKKLNGPQTERRAQGRRRTDATPLAAPYDAVYPGGPEARFRERLWTIGIALVVSASFGLVSAAYVVTRVQANVTDAAIHAAKVNCQSQAASRVSGDQFRFAIREELRFIPDAIAAGSRKLGQTKSQAQAGKEFLAVELGRLRSDLARERVRIPGLPRQVSSFSDLFPILADTPLLNCSITKLAG